MPTDEVAPKEQVPGVEIHAPATPELRNSPSLAILDWAWVLPALAILGLIVRYGVAVPFWDHFTIAQTIIVWHDRGYPLWSELMGQWNDSRMFFPKLLYWLNARFVGWDQRLELLTGWLFVLGTVVLLRATGKRDMPGGFGVAFGFYASALSFAIAQYANFLFGVSWCVFVPMWGLMLGIWAAGRAWGAVWKLGVAATGAVVASYSFANGLAVWGLMFPVLAAAVAGSRRERAVLLAGWAALMAVGVGYYFHGYQFAGQTRAGGIDDPWKVAGDAAIFIGNGPRVFADLRGSLGATRAVGIAGIAAVVALGIVIVAGGVVRRTPDVLLRAVPWMMLPAYSLMSALAVAVGRAREDSYLAVSERYPTHGLPLFISLFPLAYLAVASWRGSREWSNRVVTVVAAVVLSLLGLATVVNLPMAVLQWGEGRRQSRAVAMLIVVAPNPILVKYALLERIETPARLLPMLAERGLLRFPLVKDPFLPAQTAKPDGRLGAVDQIWRDGVRINVLGWAVAPGRPGRHADIVAVAALEPDGRYRLMSSSHDTFRPRPDVPKLLGRSYTSASGFHLPFETPQVPPGTQLTFWTFDSDTQQFTLFAGPVPAP